MQGIVPHAGRPAGRRHRGNCHGADTARWCVGRSISRTLTKRGVFWRSEAHGGGGSGSILSKPGRGLSKRRSAPLHLELQDLVPLAEVVDQSRKARRGRSRGGRKVGGAGPNP